MREKGVCNCIDTAQRTITLHNRQTTQRLNLRLLRRITRALLHEARPHGAFDLAIYVVAEPEMTRLNETYLRHQGCTDVITFDYAENVGQASRLSPLGYAPALEVNRRDACPTCCTVRSLSAWTRRCPKRAVSMRPGRASWCATSFTECCTCSAMTMPPAGPAGR